MSAQILAFDSVRSQHERLADDLRRNVDAEPTIAAIADLFLADEDFQNALCSLPDDLRAAVAQHGRDRLYALGYPRPKRKGDVA